MAMSFHREKEMSRQPQDKDKVMLRLPDGWRTALKVSAARNERSLNAEILFRLKPTLEEDQEVERAIKK